jgi:hypothetical protein
VEQESFGAIGELLPIHRQHEMHAACPPRFVRVRAPQHLRRDLAIAIDVCGEQLRERLLIHGANAPCVARAAAGEGNRKDAGNAR